MQSTPVLWFEIDQDLLAEGGNVLGESGVKIWSHSERGPEPDRPLVFMGMQATQTPLGFSRSLPYGAPL